MDPFGEVIRSYVRQQLEANVKTAASLAQDFRDGGLNKSQTEEMLYSTGYEPEVIDEALNRVFT